MKPMRIEQVLAATLWISLFSAVGIPVAGSAQEPSLVISKGIQLISEQRTLAETQVSILTGLMTDQEITSQEYGKAKTLYSEAEGAFNGWIDRLVFDLRQGQELSSSDDYQVTLKRAADKGDDFVEYVQELFLGKQQGGAGAIALSLLKPLTDAGIAIWTEVKEQLQIRRDHEENVLKEVKAQLIPLKWKPFDEVQAKMTKP